MKNKKIITTSALFILSLCVANILIKSLNIDISAEDLNYKTNSYENSNNSIINIKNDTSYNSYLDYSINNYVTSDNNGTEVVTVELIIKNNSTLDNSVQFENTDLIVFAPNENYDFVENSIKLNSVSLSDINSYENNFNVHTVKTNIETINPQDEYVLEFQLIKKLDSVDTQINAQISSEVNNQYVNFKVK